MPLRLLLPHAGFSAEKGPVSGSIPYMCSLWSSLASETLSKSLVKYITTTSLCFPSFIPLSMSSVNLINWVSVESLDLKPSWWLYRMLFLVRCWQRPETGMNETLHGTRRFKAKWFTNNKKVVTFRGTQMVIITNVGLERALCGHCPDEIHVMDISYFPGIFAWGF